MEILEELLVHQAGVISRAQVRTVGLQPHDIRRKLRRREWVVVHEGVYVNHTGPLTWLQRAWSAVLFAWPAALCHRSSLRATDGPGRRGHDDDPIDIAIDRDRSVRAPEGIVVHRLADLDDKALWNTSPPRLRIEEAALDVAAEATCDFDAVALLGDAVQSRRTTAARLLAALERRSRLRRRAFLKAVLLDVKDGACSALEHAYLLRVERPHGLPVADRQVVASSHGPLYRDVVYGAYATVIELDGRLFHGRPEARDRDLERDLDAVIDSQLTTVRLGWGQAVERPCTTAQKIGRLLARNGWAGQVDSCATCRQR
ncbi:MAG TPA: hypothetical protein VFE07_15445 [Marmoricola sp.]|jgi:hypothetical protein|nr:hypothetical protein [Marmoricola sp.]